MPIKPDPQHAFVAGGPVTVKLTSDPPNGDGLMRVLVNGEERAFRTFEAQPPAKTQRVHVFGDQGTVTIQAGWGTAADSGKTLRVSVDTESADRTIP